MRNYHIHHTHCQQPKQIHSQLSRALGHDKGKKSKSLRCRSIQNLGSEIEAVNFKVQGKIQPSKYRGTQTLNTHPQRTLCVILQLAWNRTPHRQQDQVTHRGELSTRTSALFRKARATGCDVNPKRNNYQPRELHPVKPPLKLTERVD